MPEQAADEYMRKASVLIVENDGLMAIQLSQSLDKTGYHAINLEYSGENAIDKIGKGAQPDIVLIDSGLGGKLDCIQTAREIQQIRRIPVIFLAGQNEIPKILKSRGIYRSKCVQKPFLLIDLVDAIDTLLKR